MQTINLLQGVDPRLDVRVLLGRGFDDRFHCQAVEYVFQNALHCLRLLSGRHIQAAKHTKVFAAVVLETVLILRFLLILAVLLLEVRASLAKPLGPTCKT